MANLGLRFALALLAVFTVSRLALAIWLSERIEGIASLGRVMLGGLRIDASLLALLLFIPLLLAPWLGHRAFPTRIAALYFRFAFVLIVFLEAATPGFIAQYDTRPNRLFVEYLSSPREVGEMLLKGFAPALVACVAAAALAAWLSVRLFPMGMKQVRMPGWTRPLVSVAVALVLGLAMRGSVEHRPLNPSSVAFTNDALVNTLPLNSFYSVGYAVYSSRNERSSQAAYGRMPVDEMNRLVRATAAMQGAQLDEQLPTLHRQVATSRRERPLNLVIIIQESLGAQFVGNLGGRDLTPNIDRLSREAWNFRRAYATGTRSARGLEALTAGFPPTPSESVLKLPGSQAGFFTLAQLLGRHGYGSRFVYGGEAHFDNMRGFFLGNGFEQVIDRDQFVSPQFVGTWGASDDDLYRQLDRLLAEGNPRPMLTVAFTVSNHTPWEFPPGRVNVEGKAGEHDAIRYADRALGDYLERAKAAPYWKDTVFLVIADHDARVSGASLVPIGNFHIPAFILGANVVARQDNRLVSQIDMAPTLLSLIGVDSVHPMTGADLTSRSPARAVMQYGDNFGYLTDDRLVVLQPGKPASQHRVTGGTYEAAAITADPDLGRIALAHALWPEWAYKQKRFRLPLAR